MKHVSYQLNILHKTTNKMKTKVENYGEKDLERIKERIRVIKTKAAYISHTLYKVTEEEIEL